MVGTTPEINIMHLGWIVELNHKPTCEVDPDVTGYDERRGRWSALSTFAISELIVERPRLSVSHFCMRSQPKKMLELIN